MAELWECDDPVQWFSVWSQYGSAIQWRTTSEKKGGTKLAEYDDFYRNELPARIKSRSPPFLTKDELLRVVDWKHTRGQFRPNRRHVEGIPEATIKDVSAAAFKALGNKPSVDGLATAISLLSGKEMKGVGPATATAILAACDESIPFLADEALAAVVPDKWAVESSRYTAPTVAEFTQRLRDKSHTLLASLGHSASATFDPTSNKASSTSATAPNSNKSITAAGTAPSSDDAASAVAEAASGGGGKRKRSKAAALPEAEIGGDAEGFAGALTPCQLERALWVADVFSDRPTKKRAPVRGGSAVEGQKVVENKGKGSKKKK
eukprot:jgi/Mesvir1/25929/Mv20923-RA.1